MEKTTIYLPADLKAVVKDAARRRRVSEATVIRDAIRTFVEPEQPPPTPGLFASGDPMGERVDELLAALGER